MNNASPIELWQAEWCPHSHRVRQRLTELGVACLIRQVPVEADDRDEMRAATGTSSIPALVTAGEVIDETDEIIAYLDEHFDETSAAQAHRDKAEEERLAELQRDCRELARS